MAESKPSAAPLVGPIATTLLYLKHEKGYLEPGGAPYYMNYPVQDLPQTNTNHQPHEVLVRDLRQDLDQLNMDTHGFRLYQSPTLLIKQDFEDDDIIRNKYYPEVEALLKSALGARQVHIWEHTVRTLNLLGR